MQDPKTCVQTLRSICIKTLISYKRYLSDIGDVPTELLHDVFQKLSASELSIVEDCTLAGSGRDLQEDTDVYWFKLYKAKYGSQPLHSGKHNDEVIDALSNPPSSYRTLFAEKEKELASHYHLTAQKLKSLKCETEKQIRTLRLIDPLPRRSTRSSNIASGSRSNAVSVRSKLLRKLGLINQIRSNGAIRIRPLRTPKSNLKSMADTQRPEECDIFAPIGEGLSLPLIRFPCKKGSDVEFLADSKSDNPKADNDYAVSQSHAGRRKRSGPRSKDTHYVGVTQYKRTGRWEAHIWCTGNSRGSKGFQKHLGAYLTDTDAAQIYDYAILRFRGQEAELNFPMKDYSNDDFWLKYKDLDKFKFIEILRDLYSIRPNRPVPPRPGELLLEGEEGSPQQSDNPQEASKEEQERAPFVLESENETMGDLLVPNPMVDQMEDPGDRCPWSSLESTNKILDECFTMFDWHDETLIADIHKM